MSEQWGKLIATNFVILPYSRVRYIRLSRLSYLAFLLLCFLRLLEFMRCSFAVNLLVVKGAVRVLH